MTAYTELSIADVTKALADLVRRAGDLREESPAGQTDLERSFYRLLHAWLEGVESMGEFLRDFADEELHLI